MNNHCKRTKRRPQSLALNGPTHIAKKVFTYTPTKTRKSDGFRTAYFRTPPAGRTRKWAEIVPNRADRPSRDRFEIVIDPKSFDFRVRVSRRAQSRFNDNDAICGDVTRVLHGRRLFFFSTAIKRFHGKLLYLYLKVVCNDQTRYA